MNEKTIIVKQGSFGSLVRGIVIGAAIGLLFAPRSGHETRDMLAQRGNEMKDQAMDMANNTRDRAQTFIDDARNKINDSMKSVTQGSGMSKRELERDVEIMEDINNPNYNL
jgi:gas vesicle protein